MEIIEFKPKYANQAKALLVELQKYIIKMDVYSLNIMGEDFEEQYYKRLLSKTKRNNGKIYIAKSGEKVVGLIAGYIEKYSKSDAIDYACPKKGIIAELIVTMQQQKNGVGQKLMDKMQQYFVEQGCEYISLEVFAYNQNARRFYEKNGFGERCVIMAKKIKTEE